MNDTTPTTARISMAFQNMKVSVRLASHSSMR